MIKPSKDKQAFFDNALKEAKRKRTALENWVCLPPVLNEKTREAFKRHDASKKND